MRRYVIYGIIASALISLGFLATLVQKGDPVLKKIVPAQGVYFSMENHSADRKTLQFILRILQLHYVDPQRMHGPLLFESAVRAVKDKLKVDIDRLYLSETIGEKNDSPLYEICKLKRVGWFLCRRRHQRMSVEKSYIFRIRDEVFQVSASDDDMYQPLISALEIVLDRFSSQKSSSQVTQTFINGILEGLDPHSKFLSEKEYDELKNGTQGHFGGIGVVVDEIHHLPIIREIVPNSPADMEGLEPGDAIIRIGYQNMAFKPLKAVISALRKVNAQNPVEVWVYREKSKRLFSVVLERDEIPTRSVERRIVPKHPHIFAVRITSFSSFTVDELLDSYETALEEEGDFSHFLLDLRGNPGGLLEQAVEVANLFISGGSIVSTRSRFGEQVEVASQRARIKIPVVVLVNASSASASEILAGAIQDRKRGIVIGERTYGKGSVQSLFETQQNQALKLTVAHYFTPNGKSLQNTGVNPDILVKLIQIKEGELWHTGVSEVYRESDLKNALLNPSAVSGNPKWGDRFQKIVWSFVPSYARTPGGHDELNFTYPVFENRDGAYNLSYDAAARAAVFALKDMKADSVADVEAITQKMRLKEILYLSRFHKKGKNVFQTFTEGKGPVLYSGRVAAKSQECCNHKSYTLTIKAQSSIPLPKYGFLGMRLASAKNGAMLWKSIEWQYSKQAHSYEKKFQIPSVFKKYLTQRKRNPVGEVIHFYYWPHFKQEPLLVGSLPYRPSTVAKRYTNPGQPELTGVVNQGERSRLIYFRINLTGGHPWGISNWSLINEPNFSNVNTEEKSKGGDADSFLFDIIPVLGTQVFIPEKRISLKRLSESRNLLEGQVQVTFRSNSMSRFSGLVGGVLSYSDGTVLGVWPLFQVKGKEISPLNGELPQAQQNLTHEME